MVGQKQQQELGDEDRFGWRRGCGGGGASLLAASGSSSCGRGKGRGGGATSALPTLSSSTLEFDLRRGAGRSRLCTLAVHVAQLGEDF